MPRRSRKQVRGLPQAVTFVLEEAVTDTTVFNVALGYLGKLPVQSASDSSVNAKRLRRHWLATRRTLFASHPFNAASRRWLCNRTANAAGGGWTYEFALPADCLQVFEVNGWKFDQSDDVWSVTINANNKKVLWSSDPTAEIFYAFDQRNLDLVHPSVIQALGAALAAATSRSFSDSKRVHSEMERTAKQKLNEARSYDSTESSIRLYTDETILDERL